MCSQDPACGLGLGVCLGGDLHLGLARSVSELSPAKFDALLLPAAKAPLGQLGKGRLGGEGRNSSDDKAGGVYACIQLGSRSRSTLSFNCQAL